MKFSSFSKLVAASLLAVLSLPAKQQALTVSHSLLQKLCKSGMQPWRWPKQVSMRFSNKSQPVQKQIDEAAGCAVFNATNVNIVLLVLARGEGVLFDKRRKDPIFMQDLKTGEGVGAGYQA